MNQQLQEHIFKVGLLACVPTGTQTEMLSAVQALVKGGICGVIVPFGESTKALLEALRAQYQQLLIGVQGSYEQTGDLCVNERTFAVDEVAPARELANFCLRQGDNLMNDAVILAQCGNNIVQTSDMKQQAWERITTRAQRAIEELLGFELRHVGINHPTAQQADQTAAQFEHLFGFAKTDKGGAYFAGPYIESMKKMFYGTHGHIAIATANAQRAAFYLAQRGAQFNWKSADYNPDGTLRVVYLQDEIGGFAVHILQK